jgi:hypothetical protein
MMPRLPDWPARMRALIAERLHAPFRWGVNDCALFAADAVIAQCGIDPAEDLRGLNARKAVRYVRQHGGLHALATRALGPAGELAGPGDILLMSNAGREVLAVFNGSLALAPGATGLVGMPPSSALAAWRV